MVIALLGFVLLTGGCTQAGGRGGTEARGYEGTQNSGAVVRGCGSTQVYEEPHRMLPEGVVKADEMAGCAVYTMTIQEASEDDPADIKSLWLYDLKTGAADSLFTTNPHAELRWADMNGHPVEVALTQIAAADKVCFVPDHPQLLLVEGCPEARNVWTYIIDLEAKTARQFPSTEGLLSFSASGDTLVLGAYRYHEEGGRYSVARTYTLDGQFIKEEEIVN